MKTPVTFFPADYSPDCGLTYVIIGARYIDNWIFVYHNRRKGYGLPAGHIDDNEIALEAAQRELREETGAVEFAIDCIATYTVFSGDKMGSGRLYYAKVSSLGDIIDKVEIGNILLSQTIPENLLYPDIQMVLFRKLVEYFDYISRE